MARMSRRTPESRGESLREVSPPRGRLIAIGDIHGCYEELTALLDRVDPRAGDLVVSVGDMVTKGPHSARCLDLWRDRGYLAVLGNNEIRLLESARPMLRFLSAHDRDVLWRGDLLRYLASWPLVIDVPALGISAVHGGFLPQMEVSRADVETHRDLVYHLRWIRKKNGDWKYVPKKERRKDDALWAEKWRGNRFVVYGHTPLREPKFDKCALGLDTGCVYGGSLTAGIYQGGEWSTLSVPAKRKYAD
jgi:serine/threonine protein phosphatase 1